MIDKTRKEIFCVFRDFAWAIIITMIISASRRTDIPAFYTDWLLQRLREQYCVVPNPFNPRQVARISLRPQEVDVPGLLDARCAPAAAAPAANSTL